MTQAERLVKWVKVVQKSLPWGDGAVEAGTVIDADGWAQERVGATRDSIGQRGQRRLAPRPYFGSILP